MKESKTKYYSLSEIRNLTGIPRYRISVLVDLLKLPTYRGPNNSKTVDEAGLRAIKAHSIVRPERVAV